MPTAYFNDTQWYVNCAHVNIIGSGGGSLEGYDFAKFPGTYDIMDPGELTLLTLTTSHLELTQYAGLWVAYEIANGPKGLSNYVAPGPAVWKG